jgi:hypothetical protein
MKQTTSRTPTSLQQTRTSSHPSSRLDLAYSPCFITLQPHESSEDSELRRRTPPKVEHPPRFPLPLTALDRFDTKRGRHVDIDTTSELFAILQSDHLSSKQTRHARFDSSGRRHVDILPTGKAHSPYVRQMTSAARRFTGQQVQCDRPTEAEKVKLSRHGLDALPTSSFKLQS